MTFIRTSSDKGHCLPEQDSSFLPRALFEATQAGHDGSLAAPSVGAAAVFLPVYRAGALSGSSAARPAAAAAKESNRPSSGDVGVVGGGR